MFLLSLKSQEKQITESMIFRSKLDSISVSLYNKYNLSVDQFRELFSAQIVQDTIITQEKADSIYQCNLFKFKEQIILLYAEPFDSSRYLDSIFFHSSSAKKPTP